MVMVSCAWKMIYGWLFPEDGSNAETGMVSMSLFMALTNRSVLVALVAFCRRHLYG